MGKLDTAFKVVELGKNAHDLAGATHDMRHADKGELGRQAGRHAFDTGADTGKEMGKTWLKTFEVIPRFVCRGLQFLFALIACGFYGNRVAADTKAGHGHSPEWVFAVFVAGLSAVVAVLFVAVAPLSALPFVGRKLKFAKTYRAFPLDMLLFLFWLIMFGMFGKIFLGRPGDDKHRYKGASTTAMKTAVWVDLVNVLLWIISGVYGAIKTFLGEKVNALSDRAGNKLFSKKQAPNKEAEMHDYAESV